MRKLPQGVDSSFLDGCPGGGILIEVLNPTGGKMFTLFDVRPENQILVIAIFTVSMCQNFSISFPAAPGRGGGICLFTRSIIMTCRVSNIV